MFPWFLSRKTLRFNLGLQIGIAEGVLAPHRGKVGPHLLNTKNAGFHGTPFWVVYIHICMQIFMFAYTYHYIVHWYIFSYHIYTQMYNYHEYLFIYIYVKMHQCIYFDFEYTSWDVSMLNHIYPKTQINKLSLQHLSIWSLQNRFKPKWYLVETWCMYIYCNRERERVTYLHSCIKCIVMW